MAFASKFRSLVVFVSISGAVTSCSLVQRLFGHDSKRDKREQGLTVFPSQNAPAVVDLQQAAQQMIETWQGADQGFPGVIEVEHKSHGFLDNGVFPPRAEFGLVDDEKPLQVAFTGEQLWYKCQSDAGYIGRKWNQQALLAAFSGDAVDYFSTAIASLEETDPARLARPATPALPNARAKFGAGGSGNALWQLNIIRFRPDHFKLGYELNLSLAAAHPDLKFAAMIHGFSIAPKDLKEYYRDIDGLPADEQAVGCALMAFLEKWVPRSYFAFSHLNIQELKDINEWRYVEFKLGQTIDDNGTKKQKLVGRFDAPFQHGNKDLSLAISPMGFPLYVSNGPFLLPAPNNAAIALWWSGEHSDRNLDLILPNPVTGAPVAMDHVARNSDATYTCWGCHARKFGVALDDSTTQLPAVASNFFRHAAYGVSPPFGMPRIYNRATYSEAFSQMLKRSSQVLAGQLRGGDRYSCDGQESFADVEPLKAQCVTCHFNGNKDGREPLETEANWIDFGGAALTFIEGGTMPPGGDLSANRDLARNLFCWNKNIAPPACDKPTNYAEDIAPYEGYCTSCHAPDAFPRVSLSGNGAWQAWAQSSYQLLKAKTMPPATNPIPDAVREQLLNATRCLK